MSSPQTVSVQQLNGLTDLLSLQTRHLQRYPFLLQSTANNISADKETDSAGDNARYDVLFAFPGRSLILSNDDAKNHQHDFLNLLDQSWKQEAIECELGNNVDLPFYGGWFLYLGYELAGQIEHRLELPMPSASTPVAQAVRIPAAIINDHLLNKTFLVAEPGTEHLLSDLFADIQDSANQKISLDKVKVDMRPDPDNDYINKLEQVKRYIYDGDVFQVNLSRKWQGQYDDEIKPGHIYQQLIQTNPAPFSGLAYLDGLTVISSSPERLVQVRKNSVNTRPIAGTRPRSHSSKQDSLLKSELIQHPKERAEHIMLIDLERNDLGRICEPGSIEVNELMVLESYAHVHHIVSNVRGKLRENITPGEVIRAVFPGGTITGCPKERCMAIIAELEQEARGAYTGSMGYLNHNGDMDLNILIRTITMEHDNITIRAGAGLVSDSVAERELQETCHKARGMLLAVGAVE